MGLLNLFRTKNGADMNETGTNRNNALATWAGQFIEAVEALERPAPLPATPALTGDPAVRHATVDLDAARASVTYDPATLTVDDLCAAVTGVGYRATRAAPAAPGS